MSDFVLDASLALQWFLEDEIDRKYSLAVLATLANRRALVPFLWFYEIGNGLLMAERRKRISLPQVEEFLNRIKGLPIDIAQESADAILAIPPFAYSHSLTSYDAAYLRLAGESNLPLATNDGGLRRAAFAAGVALVSA